MILKPLKQLGQIIKKHTENYDLLVLFIVIILLIVVLIKISIVIGK